MPLVVVVVRHGGGLRRACGDHCWTNRVELASCFSTPRLGSSAARRVSSSICSARRHRPLAATSCRTKQRHVVVATRQGWWTSAARHTFRDSRKDSALRSSAAAVFAGIGVIVGFLAFLAGQGPPRRLPSSIGDRVARCESKTTTALPPHPWRTPATPTLKHSHPPTKSLNSPVRDGDDNEEDEPTDCFLCRTHRRGPCRTPWRQLERCVAATPSSSPSSAPPPQPSSSVDVNNPPPAAAAPPPTEAECTAAARSFEACWRRHPNLHHLIALQVRQEDLLRREPQGADQAQSRKSWRNVHWDATAIDWTAWTEFAAGPSAGELVRSYRTRSGDAPTAPLWERFAPTTPSSSSSSKPHHSDPHLVTVECRVPPALQGQTTLLAYAVDQHDRLLGFTEPRRFPASNTHHNNNTAGDPLQASDAAKRDDDNSPLVLRITIVPGVTQSVRVCARTSVHNSGRLGEDHEGPSDGLLFRSPRWPVNYAALHQIQPPNN